MQIFSDRNELMQYAKIFVETTIDRLEKVVEHCLYEIPEKPNLYATFPAIFYCFSTIDLLGALYVGNATRNADTSSQAKEYMQKFMNYKPESCQLLMNQFRHKIAHLAEPKPVIKSNGRNITWRYEHNRSTEHLEIKKLQRKKSQQITSKLYIEYDHMFQLSIMSLFNDIKASTVDYLYALETDNILQEKFEKAIAGIYS